MKNHNPPSAAAITTTPITTPAAIPAVFGLLEDSSDDVGLLDADEVDDWTGALVGDGAEVAVEEADVVVLEETGSTVGMLSATPLS